MLPGKHCKGGLCVTSVDSGATDPFSEMFLPVIDEDAN